MRRALSLFAAAVIMLVSVSATAAPDAGPDAGIMTAPSPSNPTIPVDSGTTDAGQAAPSGDSGGCSVVALSANASEGWSTLLGLVTAASILIVSRRRRRDAV
jgi:LPXTG-motif cell wall-anchored protein